MNSRLGRIRGTLAVLIPAALLALALGTGSVSPSTASQPALKDARPGESHGLLCSPIGQLLPATTRAGPWFEVSLPKVPPIDPAERRIGEQLQAKPVFLSSKPGGSKASRLLADSAKFGGLTDSRPLNSAATGGLTSWACLLLLWLYTRFRLAPPRAGASHCWSASF